MNFILPHYILKHILSYVLDDIDRMCFVMCCRQLFQDRDKFLTFNKQVDLQNNIYFQFNSFRKQFSKKKGSSFRFFEHSKFYEYYLSGLIPSNITHLLIALNAPLLKQGLIPRSVTDLEFSDDFNQEIPPNFKDVDIYLRILDEKSTIVFNLNKVDGGLIPTESLTNQSFFKNYSNYLAKLDKLNSINNSNNNYSSSSNNFNSTSGGGSETLLLSLDLVENVFVF
ncbi:hypothetical protein PPL_05943 [Heterostelium album PN500]|uniref:F-box domain-containing protein n=1 Tax=Heterostelium pallidum (strain ATCC 26659 / Pp 5 / PN500) TaxID=670386 RepID=D3BBS4_HETP5|nr:hypothetical protein PPL_05943 [Heterostelium album PN500]EFA81107.1 hypothetical protein PPL_05943 [Heterostelium album PN500]|eukprot:XP_020433225.1 hypothetical protein PPL_05943 [Heterostelium album PN500]